MDEMMMLSGSGLDPVSLGQDGGIIIAINEMTNWAKDLIRSWGFEPALKRFYTALPVVCGISLCYLMFQDLWMAAEQGFRYGVLSMFAWNIYRTSIKGA